MKKPGIARMAQEGRKKMDIKALIAKMTLEEKAGLLSGADF